MALGLSVEKLLEMRGKPVYDSSGDTIGSIEDIYIDDRSREPEWLGLGTGFLGMKHAIVPLAQASIRDDGLAVPYEKDMVNGAPGIADDEDISADQESELSRYYGIDSSTSYAAGAAASTAAPASTSGPEHATMTRSEEEMHVGKRDVPAGRVRVRKFVETQPASQDVERTPVDRPLRPDEGLGDHSVSVTDEEPVIETAAPAKEEVALGRAEETRWETVSGDLRKERVEAGDSTDDGFNRR
ncbi:MAG: PRC and DUF2382 domain-containing protein [Dehalococcoidia bacterium]|nr:PRC and DUF2382 domain-containing protein [Dehalococcoidia bacterium]